MKKNLPPVLDPLLIEAMACATPPEPPDAQAGTRMRDALFRRVHAAAPGFRFVHSHEGDWLTLFRGVEFKLLREDAAGRAYLLRLAPGARLPGHRHAADEESLILEGDATINGVLCRAGDYHFAPPGRPHGRITSEGGCLMFVRDAAATPDVHA